MPVTHVRVVQLSDSHLSRRHGFFVGNWASVVKALAADPPAFVVNTGDLSINGADDDDDLAFAMAQHHRLPAPWRVIAGNHDIGEEHEALMIGQPIDARRVDRWSRLGGAHYWSVDLGRWRLIGIDGFLYGSGLPVEEEQHGWLLDALRTAGGPVALFVHKPLFLSAPDEPPEPEYTFVPANRGALLEAIRDAPVRFVASGHLHQSRRSAGQGFEFVWAPSCAFPASQPMSGASSGLGWVEHEFDGEDWQATVVERPELVRQSLATLRGEHRFLFETPPHPPDPADL